MSDPKIDARARLRHDLRTPLHQIIGYAELIADEARDAGLLGGEVRAGSSRLGFTQFVWP